MSVIWVSDDTEHLSAGIEDQVYELIHPQSLPDLEAQPSLIVIYANAGSQSRAQRQGLGWLQLFRRKFLSTAPALVYSFETRQSLARDFTMLNPGEPGIGFLRLPFTTAEFQDCSNSLALLTVEQLQEFNRWHGGLQQVWSQYAHRFSGYMKKYPFSHESLRTLLAAWSETILSYARDQKKNLDNLHRILNTYTSERDVEYVRMALQVLDEGLQRRPEKPQAAAPEPDAPIDLTYESPPLGFTKILVADDQGYEDFTIRELTLLGYEVVATSKNITQAERDIHYGKPQIVLADLNYPTEREGRKFMELALRDRAVRLVVCISKAWVDARDLPEGVVNCSGAVDSRNAKLLHHIIWRAASEMGVNETAGRSRVEDGRARLEALLQKINWHAGAWHELPSAITKVISRARHMLAASETERERTVAQAVIDSLSPFAAEENLSLAAIKAINSRMPDLWALARQSFGRDERDWLYNELHNRISQYLPLVNVDACLDDVRHEIDKLRRLPERNLLVEQFGQWLESTADEALSLAHLESLAQQLSELTKGLPKASIAPRRLRGKSLGRIPPQHFRIVVVEDNKAWQQFALGAIQRLKDFLFSDYPDSPYQIEVEIYDNVADALEALKPRKIVSIGEETAPEAVKTMALVDLGLPADSEEARRIANSTDADAPQPDRRNGRELIRVLRSYGFDIPVIVLTTAKESIEDVQDICSLGIEDCDYISKSLSNEEELINRLFNLIESGPRHRIEMVEETSGDDEKDDDEDFSDDYPKFRIDGIDIKLSKTLAEVFYFIFELNLKHRQATLVELSNQLARGMTAIQKDVSQIRKRIKEAFDSVHRIVGKEEIIKTISASSKGETAYKLIGDLVIKDDEESLDAEVSEERAFKVLVVENERHHLEYITQLLIGAGFSVQTATNVEDAVICAEQFRPDILSLDLHIPYTREQYEDDPLGGDAAAGIVALEGIRQRLPNIRVLIPTTNYNRADLLKQAANLDVPSSSFVRKGPVIGEAWGSDILTTANRLRLELRENRVLPPPSWSAPIIRVLKGSNFKKGILRLQVNGSFYKKGSSNQGRLLAVLLGSANRMVPFREIDRRVSKERKPVSNDARDGWLKNVRQDIREQWLHLPNDFADKPERKILESVEGGLILHAFVENVE